MTESSPQPAQRPWSRLHPSTWVVTAGFAVLAVVVVFVGDESEFTGDIDHGWPWSFAIERQEETLGSAERRRPLRLWTWDGRIDGFNTWALLANLGVLLGVLVFLAVVLEWRRRRRGFWQLSLRDLLASVLVIAAALAWFGSAYRSTSRQRQVVGNLERLSQPPDGLAIPFPSFSEDWDVRGDWIFEPLGFAGEKQPLWWADVVSVNIWGGWVDAARVAEQLQELPALRELALAEVRFTDAALKRISRMTQLEYLSLSGAGITDSQMRYLARLKNLEGLDLSYNDLSDEGLAHLHGLKQLEYLDLVNNLITDEGVTKLRRAIPGLSVSDD